MILMFLCLGFGVIMFVFFVLLQDIIVLLQVYIRFIFRDFKFDKY